MGYGKKIGWKCLGTCCWRKLHNNALHNLYSLPDCNDKMTEDGKRPFGRPRLRQKDN
jgi:hypothetical protein